MHLHDALPTSNAVILAKAHTHPDASAHTSPNTTPNTRADSGTNSRSRAGLPKLVQLVCSVARPSSHLSGRGCEFLLAVGAGEVVRVVDLAAEPQRLTVYDGMALLAHVLPLSSRLYLGVAFMAEGSPLVLDEAKVRQFLSTHFAAEAFWVPG